MITLGTQFRNAVVAITDLIVATRSRALRQELLKRQADITRYLVVLIDTNVDVALPEYQAATEALVAATKAARKAMDDIAKTPESIDKFGTAIEGLAALTSKGTMPTGRTRSVARDGGGGGGGGGGEGGGGGNDQTPVTRNTLGELPSVAKVGSSLPLTVTLTAKPASGSNAATFRLPVGSKVDIIANAVDRLKLVGAAKVQFEVQQPQPELTHEFTLIAGEVGLGRVEVCAFHNGASIATLELTTTIVEAVLDTPPPATRSDTLVRMVPRTPPDLSLFIFERDDEIKLFLQSADGAYNMNEYPPIKLQTPRAYLQEFFRTIENLPLDNEMENLRTLGLDLFVKAVPADLQVALWELRDRVRTLQIVSDEPWIPWEVCKLQGVAADGSTEEGPFFAEAFSVTRWFRGIPAVTQLRLRKLALVVPGDSGLERAQDENQYMLGLEGTGRRVVDVPPTLSEVTKAMATDDYDAWHFTGHTRASVNVDADKSAIELRKPDKLTPAQIVGKTQNVLRSRPFVFLNACQSAQGGMSLTGAGGWAQRLIKVGPNRPSASAFIGTY